MLLARTFQQSALILGLAFSIIFTCHASMPPPLVNPSPARSVEVSVSPLSADILSQQILASVSAATIAPQSAELPAADRARIQANFGKLPLSFIENQGQADNHVAYYIQSPNRSLYFTRDGHTLCLSQGKDEDAKAHTIKVELVDAATERIEGLELSPGIVSYFKGSRENWMTAIPTHSKIGYVQPWPGINVVYDGTNGKLESIYTVAPHADPSQIKLRYTGQDSLSLDDDGNLIYATSLGEIKETAPIAWQDIDGQRLPVETRFALLDDNTVAFQVAEYNSEHALIIDPVLVYAGYIGGGENDRGLGIAVDGAGNAYVVGTTNLNQVFPALGGPGLSYNGGTDVFVVKVNTAGTALDYAGYIGGSGWSEGQGIAVDSAGSAYVTGRTSSTEASFPVLVGPDLTHNGGAFDAFVAKLNPTGTALVYAGYIGGSGGEWGNGIAVDSAGNAYVTGGTTSSEASFPVTGGPDLTYNGGSYDAFVAKVNPAGTALVYAGYIGGSGGEGGNGIAVDSAGNAYVTGSTNSTEATFPANVGPDLTHNGGVDAFVAKVNSSGTALVYAGYIGGSGRDFGNGIAVDSAGNVYVAGYTESSQASFPVMGGPNLTHSGYEDAFVAKLNPVGTLVYAGYIGGSGFDYGMGIAVDSAGNAYVAGYTNSTEATFPVLVGPDLTFNGFFDVFIAKVNPTGSLVYAGYIGGNGYESGYGIAVDSAGNVYVTGETLPSETSFPVLGGPGLTHNGGSDAFIAKISAATVDVAANANSSAEVTLTNPVTLTYQIAGCQNREMYLVLNAPAIGIIWSYLNSTGNWVPLPANLSDITPFSTAGPEDGGYTLYTGTVPVGNYDLYLGCDFVTNGHLDYTGGASINGMYDYILVHVN